MMYRTSRCTTALLAGICVLLLPAVVRAADTSPTYVQAENLVRQGQWDEGIALLKQVLENEPRNLKARNLMGIALTGKGDLTAANQEYKKALEIDPRFYHALKNLAINELAQKDDATAQKHLTAALQIAPRDPVIQAHLGNLAYSRHDYRAAAGHLEKTGKLIESPAVASELVEIYLETGQQQRALAILSGLELGKLTAQPQFRLGLALARHELYQQAIPYFQAVSAAHPDSYDAAFNLAVCFVETKQFASAIEVLRGIADAGQKTAELDNLLAEAYEGNKQTQAAIDTLREATRLEPKDENNYIDLAALCTTYESYDLGLEVLRVGLHNHPQSERMIFQRGVIYAMRNQFDLAEQDFQLASRLAPEKNLSYVALGVSYMQTGNLPKAIASLRRRIREKPKDATLQYLLGEALIRSGASPGNAAFAEAKLALTKSVKLNPDFPSSRVDLAKLYLKENRLDEAVEHLERARALDPKDKAAYSQLAIVYRRKGKPELASAMRAQLNSLNNEERKGEHRVRLRVAEEDAQGSATNQ